MNKLLLTVLSPKSILAFVRTLIGAIEAYADGEKAKAEKLTEAAKALQAEAEQATVESAEGRALAAKLREALL